MNTTFFLKLTSQLGMRQQVPVQALNDFESAATCFTSKHFVHIIVLTFVRVQQKLHWILFRAFRAFVQLLLFLVPDQVL